MNISPENGVTIVGCGRGICIRREGRPGVIDVVFEEASKVLRKYKL